MASDIADKLCASVSARLEGRQIGTLSSVSRAVREAVHDACVLMLTPKRSIDILNEVRAAAPRPFSIVFCGVNGVGKSTNLAKVCVLNRSTYTCESEKLDCVSNYKILSLSVKYVCELVWYSHIHCTS